MRNFITAALCEFYHTKNLICLGSDGRAGPCHAVPGRGTPYRNVITIDDVLQQKIKCIKKCIRLDMFGYVTLQWVAYNISKNLDDRTGVAADFMSDGVTGAL